MKKMINAMKTRLFTTALELGEMAKKAQKDQRGGVSPLVVTIGLALLLLVAILTFSPTLRNTITDQINKITQELTSLGN